MAPKTSAKLSQRKTQPVVESAGDRSPSCANTGAAASAREMTRKQSARAADLICCMARNVIGAHRRAEDCCLPGCRARLRLPVLEFGARLPYGLQRARLRCASWPRQLPCAPGSVAL